MQPNTFLMNQTTKQQPRSLLTTFAQTNSRRRENEKVCSIFSPFTLAKLLPFFDSLSGPWEQNARYSGRPRHHYRHHHRDCMVIMIINGAGPRTSKQFKSQKKKKSKVPFQANRTERNEPEIEYILFIFQSKKKTETNKTIEGKAKCMKMIQVEDDVKKLMKTLKWN